MCKNMSKSEHLENIWRLISVVFKKKQDFRLHF